ncbi:MAG: polysaccharide biosynthesis protein [Phycisphaerales bacterium]
MWAQIRGTCPGVVPTGCVLVEDAGFAAGGFERLEGLPPVLGGLNALVDLHARLRFRMALVSLPTSAVRAGVLDRLRLGLRTLELEHRVVPTLAELLEEATEADATRRAVSNVCVATGPAGATGILPRVDFAELIGRTHWGLDRRAVGALLTGKRVLITGAGGSIGSELARVAAGFNPECLVLMERAENALFMIDHDLRRRFPSIARRAVLHDVVDAERTLRVLDEHRPHVVFHAAAHKHVPLMEDHPSHAVDNNLFGTKSIADAAIAVGAERFVMISSDKAVNPTSVMGATKRLAELYVAGLAGSAGAGRSRLSMVRFGNVLGSACSVIPIWQQQIVDGGPVTVTDPRMTRYFMTIPEAATLVVQAAALGSEPGAAPVYVLDMGEPVRILDLAQRLIAMHGLRPKLPATTSEPAGESPGGEREAPAAAELPIEFTGIRPGEKLFEQLAYDAEHLAATSHPGINCWRGTATASGGTAAIDITRLIADLSAVRRGGERETVMALIRKHVPEMQTGATAPGTGSAGEE